MPKKYECPKKVGENRGAVPRRAECRVVNYADMKRRTHAALTTHNLRPAITTFVLKGPFTLTKCNKECDFPEEEESLTVSDI